MLAVFKKLIPESWLDAYHRVLSWVAAAWYGHPSEELIVIGVTGTNGKTTTSYFIARVLEAMGDQTGCTTTAVFKIGTREWLNDTKMTMLGRFQLQKLLREMVRAGCRYAVVETSSQGIAQNRHRYINYDVVVLTNLTPEHIEAHGSFEIYKQAKIELFRHAARSRRKKVDGKSIPKIAILNHMSEQAKDFAVSGFDQVVWYGVGQTPGIHATDLNIESWGTSFSVEGYRVGLNLPGEVNVENGVASLAVAKLLGIPLEFAAKKLSTVGGMPGRFERIVEGQPFSVIVDYAVEPVAMGKLYETIEAMPHQRIIHVLGSCGGGRDVARRPLLGKLTAEHAQVVIITNEDPYDDDPLSIMKDIEAGARAVANVRPQGSVQILMVEDRAKAIVRAIEEAHPNDIVLLTGKGCEQAMMLAGGKRMPWDEREVARQAIRQRLGKVL